MFLKKRLFLIPTDILDGGLNEISINFNGYIFFFTVNKIHIMKITVIYMYFYYKFINYK